MDLKVDLLIYPLLISPLLIGQLLVRGEDLVLIAKDYFSINGFIQKRLNVLGHRVNVLFNLYLLLLIDIFRSPEYIYLEGFQKIFQFSQNKLEGMILYLKLHEIYSFISEYQKIFLELKIYF